MKCGSSRATPFLSDAEQLLNEGYAGRASGLANGRLQHSAGIEYAGKSSSAPTLNGSPPAFASGRFASDSQRSEKSGVPRGIRTLVTAVKGRCPGPLDDGDKRKANP